MVHECMMLDSGFVICCVQIVRRFSVFFLPKIVDKQIKEFTFVWSLVNG